MWRTTLDSDAPDPVVTTRRQPVPVSSETAGRRKWLVLGVLATAQLMLVLDVTIVNIALPAAQRDLGFADDDRQWVITAYAMAFGGLLLLGGKLTDFFGVRATFIVGLVGFAGTSALAGAATGFEMLIAGRAAQGMFAALLGPAALSLLTRTFVDPAERAKAFGIFGAIASGGGGLGLLLGGVLTDWASWRWTLFVNLVFAAIALAGALILVGRQPATRRTALDIPGAFLITLGLVGIVFGLSRADTQGWGSPVTLLGIVGGCALVAAFLVWQRFAAAPLLPLRILAERTRAACYLMMLLAAAGMFGVFLFLTYYLQVTRGYSPIRTGLSYLPMIAAVGVGSTTAASLLRRTGPRPLMITGAVLAGSGMVLLTRVGIDTGFAAVALPGMLVLGAGMGFIFGSVIQAAVSGIGPADSGVGSAAVNVMQQVGGAIGTALLSTMSASGVDNFLAGDHTPDELPLAAISGYHYAFWTAAGLFYAGAVVTALLAKGGRIDAAPASKTAG